MRALHESSILVDCTNILLLYLKYFVLLTLIAFNFLCIPESFNTSSSHQLFDYTITIVNLQHYNTNLKGDFVLKNRSETIVLKISGIQK